MPGRVAHYKLEQQALVAWLIDAWNCIVKKMQAINPTTTLQEKTNHQATVTEILTMCELVASQPPQTDRTSIPDYIYLKFRSVIRGRRRFLKDFEKIYEMRPTPQLKAYNDSHRYFVEALEKGFGILGGNEWETTYIPTTSATNDDDDERRLSEFLANRYTALVDEGPTGDSSEQSDHNGTAAAADTSRKHTKKKVKGRKKGVKKGDKEASADSKEPRLELQEWEKYRIIEDGETADDLQMTDYRLSAYGILHETMRLRLLVQDYWGRAAYQGTNTAVAAGMTKIAVANVKRTAAAIAIEFPGNESFEAVIQTVTQGCIEIERAQYQTYRNNRPASDGEGQGEEDNNSSLRFREDSLIHVYSDLLDFLHDYQKNRTGQPTKAMAKQLEKWDPELDLQTATKQERLVWRRAYTINWLYELVNVFSSPLRNKGLALDKVDWSDADNCDQIMGLGEFARTVTGLAFRKPGSKNNDVRHKVAPHLVFELACAVDAMCATRGWVTMAGKDHAVVAPPEGFRATCDIHQFLHDPKNEGFGGALGALNSLSTFMLNEPLTALCKEWDARLGQSKDVLGCDTTPPSRFASTNANGLHDYAPYLCGAGLAEALDVASRVGVATWDSTPEPLLTVHLYHMLVKKRYLKPNFVLDILERAFCQGFFGVEHADEIHEFAQDNFLGAFRQRDDSGKCLQRIRQAARNKDIDVSAMMNTGNRVLIDQEMPFLALLNSHDLDPQRIPLLSLPALSPYGLAKIMLHIVDPVKANEAKETLMKWSRISPESTLDPDDFVKMAEEEFKPGYQELAQRLTDMHLEEGHPNGGELMSPPKLPSGRHGTSGFEHGGLPEESLFQLLEYSLEADICGGHDPHPYSSFNLFHMTGAIMLTWRALEDMLLQQNNRLYARAYRGAEYIYGLPGGGRGGLAALRTRFAILALKEQDEGTLRIIAEAIRKQLGTLGRGSFVYWGDLLDQMMVAAKKMAAQEGPLKLWQWMDEAGKSATSSSDTAS